jgi:hypothetical protein
VRQLVDATGAITLAESYQPYGSLFTRGGAGTTSYGFTGEWTDGAINPQQPAFRNIQPIADRWLLKADR